MSHYFENFNTEKPCKKKKIPRKPYYLEAANNMYQISNNVSKCIKPSVTMYQTSLLHRSYHPQPSIHFFPDI